MKKNNVKYKCIYKKRNKRQSKMKCCYKRELVGGCEPILENAFEKLPLLAKKLCV